jgi:hypothetical protein
LEREYGTQTKAGQTLVPNRTLLVVKI